MSPQRRKETAVPVEVMYEGRRHAGQVVVSEAWSPELGAPPPAGVAFRIVLLKRPALVDQRTIRSNRVIVCVPGQAPIARAAEAPAMYEAGGATLEWPEGAIFAGGTVYAGPSRTVDATPLFAKGDAEAILTRLAALAALAEADQATAAAHAYLEKARPPEHAEELFLNRISLLEQLPDTLVFLNSTKLLRVKLT